VFRLNNYRSYDSSSSIMAPWFANETCDPFHPVSQPCTLGNYVTYSVNVSKPEHVSKTLAFAKENNIRVVIRNTGHEYGFPPRSSLLSMTDHVEIAIMGNPPVPAPSPSGRIT
jgi:hypothetical protein